MVILLVGVLFIQNRLFMRKVAFEMIWEKTGKQSKKLQIAYNSSGDIQDEIMKFNTRVLLLSVLFT